MVTVFPRPAAQVPATPDASAQRTVNAKGERVSFDFDASNGKARVRLTTAQCTRTLLLVQGPGEYGYRFGPVFWSPDGAWIAASDDGRVLVIVPSDPAVTRSLVTDSGDGADGGTVGPTFAVSATDFLSS